MFKKKFEEFLISRQEELLSVQEMKQGTESKVFLVNNKYIFKFHNENTIKSEYEFFNCYKCELNEKIVFISEDFSYIVYLFIKNNKRFLCNDSLILKLINYVEHYPEFKGDKFGFLYEETETWKDFLLAELNGKKDFALKVLSETDLQKTLHAVEVIDKYKFNKKLMHGDFGLYNLLFYNNELVGIIDPQPIIGDPLYDFIFCIFSEEDIATLEVIENIYKFVPSEPKEKVDSMMRVVLFGRIARCVKYNLSEKNYFIDLWNKLNN